MFLILGIEWPFFCVTQWVHTETSYTVQAKVEIMCLCSTPLYPLVQRVVKSSWRSDHSPVSCRESGERQSGPARVHEERFRRGSLYSIRWSCALLQRHFSMVLFSSLCFEILSCWTHTWAVFQPWLWRQQAERRPLIFLPKDFFPLCRRESGSDSGIEPLWAVQ